MSRFKDPRRADHSRSKTKVNLKPNLDPAKRTHHFSFLILDNRGLLFRLKGYFVAFDFGVWLLLLIPTGFFDRLVCDVQDVLTYYHRHVPWENRNPVFVLDLLVH